MAVSSRRQFSAEKGICHMSETTITQLPDPSGFSSDPFTEVLRNGARDLIEQAIHAELATLMAAFSNETLEDGRARLVRHGHLPEREVMTGIGPVPVKVPRVRDRALAQTRSPSRPAFCHATCGKRNRSKSCCLGFTSRVYRPVISPRPWKPCLARTPRGCRPRLSPG